MVSNGLFHLLINGVYWGYNPLILTFDPTGHPSMFSVSLLTQVFTSKLLKDISFIRGGSFRIMVQICA